MMQITATELKMNLGKYLELAETEKILITKHGAGVAFLTPAKRKKKTSIVDGWVGILRDEGMTEKDYREERLRRYESND